MNRDEFNKLDVNSQVQYFNEELKKDNNNFNAICKQIGISKNTIMNRFKANGFEPSRDGQKISKFLQAIGKIEVEKLTAQNCSVEKKKLENIKTENSAMKNKKKANAPCEMDLILKRMELLEQKVEVLESANLHLHKELESQGLDYDKNFINSYENTTTKTFKIDVEVYQELEKIFDKYKMYKKQDIVSSLLKYALDNI